MITPGPAAAADGPQVSPQTVRAALQSADRAGVERIDAQWLLANLLDRSRTWLIAHGDNLLDEVQWAAWLAALKRHAAGEPLAYLLQQQTFFGLALQVSPAVLVPRSDTETLVEWAVEILRQREAHGGPASVIDLGCGSGAIALALKSTVPAARVTGVDISAEALVVAAANSARLELAIDWRAGDWWAAVGDRCFDLAVSNPPYIAADDPHLAALQFEPRSALVAADDGLAALRAIIAGATSRVQPQAWLLLEHGYQQADAVTQLLRDHGFTDVQTRCDLAGRQRCSGGRCSESSHRVQAAGAPP